MITIEGKINFAYVLSIHNRGRSTRLFFKDTWKIFHVYIDAHSQRLIDEYPRYGVQSISSLKSQCASITFAYQSRYNRLFHNAKDMAISVGNSYSGD